MLLRQIGNFGDALGNSPLGQDRLWSRPADKISETEIQMFYARAALMGFREEAVDLIDRLQAQAILTTIESNDGTDLSVLVLHTPPEERFYVDELVDGLAKLSEARRGACLFALEARMSPEQVAALTWVEAGKTNWQGLAREVLAVAAATRHIRLPYVFWEWATEKIACPLLELQPGIEAAFGCTWPALVNRYSTIARIDRRADSASFLQLVDEVRSGKL
jgi:hypothetical protein